ncbi:DUF1850 domain-containing protein [Piscinibacter sp.]|jgi:hypothetical protein|uniref:DUF1850 domain-containing protein n=1 Tax=Piscinibacter sp. TaxID=1903157 RepID=UPI00355A8AF0
MPLCISAGGVVMALAMESFTLAWTHSIAKIRWEEDYRVEGSALRLVAAHIRGSRFEHGVWHYAPAAEPGGVIEVSACDG